MNNTHTNNVYWYTQAQEILTTGKLFSLRDIILAQSNEKYRYPA